jgi:hypothetical protein
MQLHLQRDHATSGAYGVQCCQPHHIQYFGQNLGRNLSNRAVVTKGFGSQTEFFQALPAVQMRTNSIDEMLIEDRPLQARR